MDYTTHMAFTLLAAKWQPHDKIMMSENHTSVRLINSSVDITMKAINIEQHSFFRLMEQTKSAMR